MIFIPFSSFSTYPGNYCNLEKYDIFLHLVPFHHSFLLTNKLQTGYFSQSQHHTTEVTGSHNRTDVNGEKKKREREILLNKWDTSLWISNSPCKVASLPRPTGYSIFNLSIPIYDSIKMELFIYLQVSKFSPGIPKTQVKVPLRCQ